MIQVVNTGTATNDGTGDPLQAAFQKINAKFVWQDVEIQRRFEQLGILTTPRGAWATATAYSSTPGRDWVTSGGQAYVAAINHVSGGTFSADLAAGKWIALDIVQLIADLAAPSGAWMVGHLPAGTGALAATVGKALNANSVNVFSFMTDAQIADVRAHTYTLDMTTPFAAAVAALAALGGGDLIAPAGGYLLNGTAGLDGYKNGILLPDTGGDFTTRNGITIIGEGVETVFRAGSANMIVVRNSRLYSGGASYRIDGNSLANVIGLGIVPESLTQTTELVSQSYANYSRVVIENCTEGTLFQPGPTVTAQDSGCFYHDFDQCVWNNNTRHIWMKNDVTASENRTTRTAFYKPVFTRGNTGIWIDGGTEIDFYSPMFELINTGTTPSATPTAFNYADTNPANIRIYGGYAEACTKALVAAFPEQVHVVGFFHNSTKDASEFRMGRFTTGRLTVSKQTNVAAYMNMGGENFAGFVADPDQTGSKTLALQLNGVDRMRWNASGSQVFYGLQGTITMGSLGREIAFGYNGSNFISAMGASAGLYSVCNLHGWQTAAGVDIASMSSAEFVPRVDNATTFGTPGLRWSAIWAANGTIQTSDPRTKKDIIDSPLGLDFIMALKPVAYKFKVGGNKVVGHKEVKPAVLNEDGEIIERAIIEPILEAGAGKRQHFGFLTTDVKEALGGVDFGGYVKADPKNPESEEALRYDEFIAPLVRAVQELKVEFDAYKATHP